MRLSIRNLAALAMMRALESRLGRALSIQVERFKGHGNAPMGQYFKGRRGRGNSHSPYPGYCYGAQETQRRAARGR